MGYTLKIGEAEMSIDKEYGYCGFDVKGENIDGAPAFGEPTDRTNSRWPSYLAWHDAMKFLGLHDLFFDKEQEPLCLIYEHPGAVVITKYHKQKIDLAYQQFYEKYPNAKAGFSPKSDGFTEDPDWPKENGYAVRLEWLKYWIDWALKNCENPIFYNS